MAILHLPKSRWGAFAGHLLISLIIFGLLFALIAYWLFPGALFQVAGGIEGIRIIAGVDLVLGPLLTLVIYNIAKPRRELYRDLSIIGGIQIAALAVGMLLVYNSRPVAVTWVLDSFQAVRASDFKRADTPLPAQVSRLGPTYWYIDLPANNADALQLVLLNDASEEPLRERTELYLPLPTNIDDLRRALRGKADEVSREGCMMVEIRTAFDSRVVCFDPVRHRFSL